MDSSERAALAALMARMAAGDQAAVVEFIERYMAQLVGTVRRIVTDSHIDLWTVRDELEGLAIDAGFVIADAAGAWRADGALPWTWAYSAIRARVLAVFGIPVDADGERDVADAAVPPVVATPALDDLADGHPVVRLWLDGLDAVATERNAEVHRQFQTQKALGDPSPAVTVAAMTGLSAANVRKINQRVCQRLSELRRSDERFAALVELPWVPVGRRHPTSVDPGPGRTVRHTIAIGTERGRADQTHGTPPCRARCPLPRSGRHRRRRQGASSNRTGRVRPLARA